MLFLYSHHFCFHPKDSLMRPFLENSTLRRINSWAILLSLLSAFLAVVELPAANAASSTTTAATVSDANPRRGDSVVFTMTVTPTAYVAGTPITGNMVISSDRGELCATYSLTEDPISHVVEASCTWVAAPDAGNIKAVYKGSTNYTTSQSSNISVSVIDVFYFSASRVNEGSSLTISAGATNAGSLAFKVDGMVIPGCSHESKTVTAGGYVNCSYTLPVSASPASGTKIFSVDYIPNSKSIMVDAHTSSYTPDKYYLPTTEGIYSSILSNFQNATSKSPFVSANYVEIDHIFYKLNRSTREALVVGYDRFAGLTELNIPEILDVTSVVLTAVSSVSYPAKNDFIGTYQVSAIGTDAFSMSLYSPTTGATLLRSIVLPPTLKIIGDRAFKGQCGISQIDIPDSVLAIGSGAFAAMNTTGAVNTQGYKMCTEAYSSSNSYSYSINVNSNAHVTYLGHVYSAKQSMSSPSPAPTDSAFWLDLGVQAPITGLTDVKVGAGVSATGSNPFYAAGNLQKVAFRGAPSDLKAVYEYRRSGLDLWGWTQAVGNWTMRHPISDQTNNTCSNYFVYAGSLEISILASQSLAWQYWAQGCLQAGADGIKPTFFKPSRPGSPTTETTTLTSSVVRFSAPLSDGGAAIETYAVQFSSTDWATWETFTSTLSSPATPFVVTGLSHSTNYKFRIIATNSVGPSIPSATSAAIRTLSPSVPTAPTIGAATLIGTNSVNVAFTASVDNGGAVIDSYTVISTPDSVTAYSLGSASGSATLTGLRSGINYSFTVRAGNSVGRSVASGSVTKKVPLTPVLGTWPNISKNKSDAPFTLTPPSESYTAAGTFGYTSSDSGIVSISGDTVTVVQSGSAVITATFYPSDTATYFSGVTKTMTISVSAASNAITFGSISARAVNAGGFNLTATALGGTVTYSSATSSSICTVTNGGAVSMFAPGTCVIKASSLGNANYGAASDVTQNLVITAAPPGAPTLTSVSVGGTDAANATSGYATLQFTANTENGGTITSYLITATPATGSAITKTVTAGAGTRTESITALSLGTEYTFTVTAYNGGTTGGGTSAASNAVAKTPAANPNAPTNLRVNSGNTTLTANWTPPVSLGGGSWDSYRVFVKRSSDSSFSDTPTAIINTQATSTYQFTGLTNGVAYDVKIWVKTTSFTTELLANTAAVYLIPATVPVAPRLAISQTDSTTVVASWASNGDGGSALTGYTLTLSSGACSFTFVPGTTSYSCSVTGLTPGTTVTGTLIATNGVGSSAVTTASVNYITVVGAPTSVVATNGDGQVTLAFAINNGGDSIVSFDYSIDGLSYSPLNATSSPVTITGLTNDLAYNIYLRARGATYGNGASSSAIAVLPHLTVTTVVQVAQTPSYIKAITHPAISQSKVTYVCARGEYQFSRSGGGVETLRSESAIYKLYINGALIESATSQSSSYLFSKSELLQASTVSCSVTLTQEAVTNEFTTLSNPLIKGHEKIKEAAFAQASSAYQIARDAAYALRVEGDSASIEVWRKSIDLALAKRKLVEDAAQAIYLNALEKEGISLFFAAPPVKKPVTAVIIQTPEKVNVQPTSVMRKVGTIYFANGTYFINDVSRKTIAAIAAKISMGTSTMVLSYGHTDSTGGVDNTLLSKNRARAVAKLLGEAISGKKVVTGWYAATKPIATGTSKIDLAKNRRVEIYIK